MQVKLDGKVALVTGAARGIGKAIGDLLAANGATVVYTDLERSAAEEAARGIPRARGMVLDVTDESQCNAVVQQVARDLGTLDILVNNAGVNTLHYRVNIDQFPKDEWDRLLQVDLT